MKDKNETIFRLIEKNIDFPLLKDIKITIYYLNPYAKGFFKKQTGIDSVEFGSIYLFINGFRIPPYGDRENDAFGLEVRKGQGTARYFSNRGMKEINKDFYALSILLQWIWRSRIRNINDDFEQRKIDLYLPSSRMKRLLLEWLDN